MTAGNRFSSFASRWERASSIPLALAGLVYLAAYSLEVVNASNSLLVSQLEALSIAIWGLFFVDIVIRLFGSSSLSIFIKTNWLEILALAIPFMRILRVFRVVLAIRGLSVFMKNRATAAGTYLLMLVPLVWFSGAIAVLDAEASNPDGSITNLREALWWSLATITTVGYGDKYPTTLEGQMVAGVLMLSGIALFSAGAGMFASWIAGGKDSK